MKRVEHRLLERLGAILGGEASKLEHVATGPGGTLHSVHCQSKRYAVKVSSDEGSDALKLEGRGLEWLAETGTVQVPALHHIEGDLLVMDWIPAATPTDASYRTFGGKLAELHLFPCKTFGLEYDNLLAGLPQPNAITSSWAEFYATRRIEVQLRHAADAGYIERGALRKHFDRLMNRMPDLVTPEETPSRLHGDLWSGNMMCAEDGTPYVIDPAVYGGSREVDLAMMRLFGGFSAACFSEYANAFPLWDGHQERVPLYQLYPLLVHVNLFGGSYMPQTLDKLRAVC